MKYVYKIIAALGSLCVLPALIFSPMFYYKISSIALQTLLTLLKSTSSDVADKLSQYSTVPDAIADSSSIYSISSLIKSASGLANSSESIDFSKIFAEIRTPLITVVIIFMLIAVCAIVTAVLAIATKNNRKVVYSSLVGLGLSIMFKFAFESLAAPFLDGTISISNLINTWWASFIAEIEALELSTAFYIIPLIFIGVIVWTVIFNFTLPEKEKAERKRMLGEAE